MPIHAPARLSPRFAKQLPARQMIAGLLLGSALFLAGCNQGGEEKPADEPTDTAATDGQDAPADSAPSPEAAELPAPYNQANLANGEAQFARCKLCHSLDDGKNGLGPSLHGVFGKKAGSVDGFGYSDALKSADITWDGANMDKWLSNPAAMVPGTSMVLPGNGMKDADERRDLIGWLMLNTGE